MSEIRVGDLEREQAASALGDHYAAGRLDAAEYAERLDAAWSARTRADLAVLFHDLPVARPAPARPPTRSGRSGRSGLPWPAWALVVLVVGGIVLTHLPVLLLILAAIVLFKVARSGGPRHGRTGTGWGGHGRW